MSAGLNPADLSVIFGGANGGSPIMFPGLAAAATTPTTATANQALDGNTFSQFFSQDLALRSLHNCERSWQQILDKVFSRISCILSSRILKIPNARSILIFLIF